MNEEKKVLITGCSSGFGYGMTVAFLRAGWTVIATMRNAEKKTDIFLEESEKFNGCLHVKPLDVTAIKERKTLFDFVTTLGGGLDCLVNNAGYALVGALEDITEEQLRHQMEVNFFGTALMTRLFLPLLRKTGGRVLNISSMFGFAGFPLTSAYCASKFAVEGLTESLHYELKPHGIQTCIIEPGGFRTRFSDNMVWGKNSFQNGSPFQLESKNYQRLKEKMSSKTGTPPGKVVRAVLHLAQAKRLPLRYSVGRDALLMRLVHRLLPNAWAILLLSSVYKKMFLKNIFKPLIPKVK